MPRRGWWLMAYRKDILYIFFIFRKALGSYKMAITDHRLALRCHKLVFKPHVGFQMPKLKYVHTPYLEQCSWCLKTAVLYTFEYRSLSNWLSDLKTKVWLCSFKKVSSLSWAANKFIHIHILMGHWVPLATKCLYDSECWQFSKFSSAPTDLVIKKMGNTNRLK